jgi:hypothetical protein
VIEEGGDIKAATFFTTAYHMEPACARPGYGKHLWGLAKFIEGHLIEDRRLLELDSAEPLIYYVTALNTPGSITRERAMGRTVLDGYVPVMKKLL